MAFLKTNGETLAKAFDLVVSARLDSETKIRRVVKLVRDLGPIRAGGKEISPLNALTPCLACLDPQHRFPVMNQKTRRLLRQIEHEQNEEGAVALSELIGKPLGIRNCFDLDVYSATAKFSGSSGKSRRSVHVNSMRELGIRSELSGYARLTRGRVRIRRVHNQLTNQLGRYLRWRYGRIDEAGFDAFLPHYKGGRHLLIEVKTAWSGTDGRTQIRQAIGQLFDYRHKYQSQFPKGEVDLAVLLPSEPGPEIKALLKSITIEVLWFQSGKVLGTVDV